MSDSQHSTCLIEDPDALEAIAAFCDCTKAGLTCEEERILGQMVKIKVEVRHVRERLEAIEADIDPELFTRLAETREAGERLELLDELERYEEWKSLSQRLSLRRDEFRKLQHDRDVANRRKMKMLGYDV